MKYLLLSLILAAEPTLAQNRVLELDGEASYVHLPGQIFDDFEEATVEAWVKWGDWGLFSQWFAFGADNAWTAMGLNHQESSTVFQFFIYTDETQLQILPLAVDLPLGRWCHMATVSGPGGMRFYLNGTLVGANGFEGSFAAIAPSPDNYLGKSNWRDNANFRGQLDEVRVWSVARSGEQIRNAMRRRLKGDEAGLAALWNFDSGDARDHSPRGHNGQLVGGARCVPEPFPGAESFRHPAVIEGTVRDESGVPLVGARAHLRRGDVDFVAMTTRLDGRYALAAFDVGAHVVVGERAGSRLQWTSVFAQDPGLQDAAQQQEVILRAGETVQLDMVAPSSKVAYWPADGHARDAVGPHDGMLVGGATFAQGLVDQAFRLGGQYDRVVTQTSPGLDIGDSFSLVTWVFPTTDNKQSDIITHVDTSQVGVGYALGIDPALGVNFGTQDQGNPLDRSLAVLQSPENSLTRNVWNHVAAVYDQASGTRRIHVNGVEVAKRQDPPLAVTASTGPMTLGDAGLLPNSFVGLIDEVSIYHRALGEVAIQRLYGVQAEAWWQGEGDADDSRGANHGVVEEDVAFSSGVTGQAFSFDGLGGHVSFNPLVGNFGTEDFTLELWVWRARDDHAPQTLLARSFNYLFLGGTRYFPNQGLIGNEAVGGLDLRLDESGRIRVELSSGSDISRLGSSEPLSVREWHHLCVVRQGREARLFVNGRLETANRTTRVVDLALLAPLILGASASGGDHFHGLIDEIAFHNHVRSPTEISDAYETNIDAWSKRLWLGRLEKGGIGLAVIVALFSSARFYSHRKARQLREVQLAEERRAREEEQRARAVADAANQAKSAFLANMSHEIRTPMNAILGYAQILRDQETLSDDQRRAVEVIHSSGDHLLELINDVLDLSKIEAGGMELQPVDFDLSRMVERLAAMFELRCQQDGLRWHVEQEGETWQVHGDENKLRQVLVNLLGNAVKFTDVGEVVLRVSSQVDSPCYFEVRDTDPGISAEQQEAVFEPFQQGGSGFEKGGTGLGLSIARRHVELMGGRLELESVPGQGTRFFFSLGLSPAHGPVGVETEIRYGHVVRIAPGPAPLVLIVDDVATNRDILAQILQHVGIQVTQAASGEEALEVVRDGVPDMVFMDIRMSGMDGLETIRQIRREHGQLPAAAISASVMQHEQQYYLKSGFNAFINKPFLLEHIYACLAELLGVEYEYAQPVESDQPAPVDFAGLRLPASLRSQLFEAAEMHNVTEVKLGLDRLQDLGAHQAQLAAHLSRLVQRYDFGSVLQVIERTEDE